MPEGEGTFFAAKQSHSLRHLCTLHILLAYLFLCKVCSSSSVSLSLSLTQHPAFLGTFGRAKVLYRGNIILPQIYNQVRFRHDEYSLNRSLHATFRSASSICKTVSATAGHFFSLLPWVMTVSHLLRSFSLQFNFIHSCNTKTTGSLYKNLHCTNSY